MSLKPYPEYQDSHVDWLGEVPKNWTVQPATAICRVITSTVDKKSYEGEIAVRLCNYTDVYYNDVLGDNPEYMKATATPAQIALFTPKAGDVAITKDSETSDDIGIPSYVPFDMPGIVFGYHLAIYRPEDKRYGRFLRYLFESKYVKVTFENKTPGVTRVGLSQNTLKYLRVPTPPIQEAQAIADYLDRETEEIDAFIVDQEELIALLGERRTATIAHAVTKGLDPEATMKESGIEWLGQVPRHWSIRGIKAAAATYGGSGFPHEYQGIVTEEVPFHKVSALAGAGLDGVIRDSRDTVSRTTAKILGAKVFPAGTIVMAKIGAALLLGRMRSVDRPFCIDNNMLALVPNEGYVTKYLIYALQIVSFDLIVNPGAVPSLDMVAFRHYPLAFPSEQEQQAVADFLDHEMAEIDATITEAREAIALSRERRAAVISAAVTGKIDVRGTSIQETKNVEAESVGVA